MITERETRNAALAFTLGSMFVALCSIRLARRFDLTAHLPLFNLLALTMLGLAVVASGAGIAAVWKSGGRSVSAWTVATLAIGLVGLYLLDD